MSMLGVHKMLLSDKFSVALHICRRAWHYTIKVKLEHPMLLDTDLANDFLYKYQMLMVYLNDGEIPSGMEGFASIRPEIYDCLDELNESMSQIVGADFIHNLRGAIYGEFVYLKKYKGCYAFKHIESEKYYQAFALTTPLEEILREFVVIKTALVPFSGYLVCDGLLVSGNVALGKGLIAEVKKGYHQAKKAGLLGKIV